MEGKVYILYIPTKKKALDKNTAVVSKGLWVQEIHAEKCFKSSQ